MSYKNFIPTVWSAKIQHELERACVMEEDCNREYEGEVKEKGDSVRILGVGRPTIYTLNRENASNDINSPEELEDQSTTLQINQIRYFNFMIGDVDDAQANTNLMPHYMQETAEGLANEQDKYIASFANDSNIKKMNNSATKVTASNVMGMIDDAIKTLHENDVAGTTKLVLTAPPRFIKLVKQALISASTNNVDLLEHGKVAQYGNVIIKQSNNVLTTSSGAVDNIMLRTQRAIAFVRARTFTEAYRPEKKFADAVKGYVLFDAKVLRPKEIVNLNVKYTD